MTESVSPAIQHVVAVMGGKGGVGKSFVTGLLAVALRRQGMQVGIIDGDLAFPSIASLFGIEHEDVNYSEERFEPPVSKTGIKIMSMIPAPESEDEPLTWRGPIVSSAFKQFYTEIAWGQLDYLLIDVPPGTSDVPLTVLQSLPLDGVVIVSTPGLLVTRLVKRCVNMVHLQKQRIIGVVENMSYALDVQGEDYTRSATDNSGMLLTLAQAPLLARLPIDPQLAHLCDSGRIEEYNSTSLDRFLTNFYAALKRVK